jgi:succinate dehydrogenase / fumarate reductase, cytochrome b subunit
MDRHKPAPKYLNLLRIKLPPGGIASIGHRVSGVLMFLAVPFIAWLFALSLQSEQGFHAVRAQLGSLPGRLLVLALVWALSHHLLAGIRHLLLDMEIGLKKSSARASAWIVNVGALLVTALYLWGSL